jgi:hypothetical protein
MRRAAARSRCPLSGGLWQHQRLAELNDVLPAVAVGSFQAGEAQLALVDEYFAWFSNHVIEVLERDFDDVILGIVDDAEQRQPLGFDLRPEIERRDLDFRTLPDAAPRQSRGSSKIVDGRAD